MSRPDRPASAVVYPNPSIQRELVEVYRQHAAHLPPLSAACADGLRLALQRIGVEPPPPPPPTRTTAATAARTRQRTGGTP
jgi:hypothetical protein